MPDKNSNKKINFVFWGTPEVSSHTLEFLKISGYIPSLIITGLDKFQGRKMLLTPSPTKVWAIENNVPYIQPEKLDENLISKISEIKPDLSIVVAYGKIIKENILEIPKLGSINIHYSLLPKWRGASPVESAILNGDEETGVTIQKMEYQMDSGPILVKQIVKISPTEKASELKNRLIKVGAELLIKILNTSSASGSSPYIGGGIKQNENEATFCKKIKKEDGLINLNDEAVKNYNKFRAYALWPRSFFFQNNKRIIITDAVLENGQFVIKKVLPEGKKEIKYEEFLKSNISK